ncbi:hypothetical protein DID88_008318 [Monilinia fructigena]|uniref:Uncharacterized protein n=1 Tax=Monilinia fructigena TaxID=38457 RepID=A0A395J7D8_9HELO|nr:hypothetical protein DID88_008318 [Monilinia fructigena]
METANINAATSLSRAKLIDKTISDQRSSQSHRCRSSAFERSILEATTKDEILWISDGFIDLDEEAGDEFFAARVPAYLPNEEKASEVGIDEFWRREKAARNDRISDTVRAALPYAPECIKRLSEILNILPSIETTIAESQYDKLCCQLYDGEETVSTSVIGVTKGDAPWDSPYTAEETLAICSNGTLGIATMTCAYNLTSIDLDLLEDPAGDETEYLWPVSSPRGDYSGPPADYAIVNYANSQQRTIFTSATYPNGNHGQDLQTHGGYLHVYALSSTHCTDATIINNAPLTGRNAVMVNAEHIIERQK